MMNPRLNMSHEGALLLLILPLLLLLPFESISTVLKGEERFRTLDGKPLADPGIGPPGMIRGKAAENGDVKGRTVGHTHVPQSSSSKFYGGQWTTTFSDGDGEVTVGLIFQE